MKIKKIEFLNKITNIENESVDVIIEDENGNTYTMDVSIPGDLQNEMERDNTNFITLEGPKIIVKKLRKEIVTEAIQAYAKDEGYYLKLYQFGEEIDISIFNKLAEEKRVFWDFEEEL